MERWQAVFCQEFVLRPRRLFISRNAIRGFALTGWLWLVAGSALAQPLDVFTPRPTGVQHDTRPANALYLHNRHIATFRATLLGDSPADRVELARVALSEALHSAERPTVTHTATPDSVRFEVNGRTVFFLVAADTGTPRPEAALAPTSQDVQVRLEKAVAEAAELRDRLRVAADLLVCLGASLLASTLVSGTLQLRERVALRIHAALHRPAAASAVARLVATFSEHAHRPAGW